MDKKEAREILIKALSRELSACLRSDLVTPELLSLAVNAFSKYEMMSDASLVQCVLDSAVEGVGEAVSTLLC